MSRPHLTAATQRPHLLLAAACLGLAAANLVRCGPAAAYGAVLLLPLAAAADGRARLVVAAAALLLGGWWWGSGRLHSLDRSVLLPRVGTAERALVETTAPARRSRFAVRVLARVLRFGALRPRELVLLELPVSRPPPPQGSRLEALGVLALPRGPDHGFDERAWLRRQGVHVVLHVDRWRRVGARGGLGGIADALHARLARDVGSGLRGERRGVVEGILLGEDGDLSESLRQDFRASGLYHLLAVSGQNVAFVAAGALALVWVLGLPRLVGEAAAIAGMAAYVLAVGPQPSVLRAGVGGVLGSFAWLSARQRDRWYALLLGAFALLAWNPYLLRDAGFELSFAAVVSIFTIVPRLRRELEGWPVPKLLADTIAVSAACGTATAPIAWLQFHALPLLTVPANAAAAPAVGPLLWLSFATVAVAPLAPGVAAATAWMNGWFAAYLAECARIVAAVPGAQVRSTRGAAAAASGALLLAAYAWQRAQRAEAGLSAHRLRPSQDRPRAAAAPGQDR